MKCIAKVKQEDGYRSNSNESDDKSAPKPARKPAKQTSENTVALLGSDSDSDHAMDPPGFEGKGKMTAEEQR